MNGNRSGRRKPDRKMNGTGSGRPKRDGKMNGTGNNWLKRDGINERNGSDLEKLPSMAVAHDYNQSNSATIYNDSTCSLVC